MQKAATLVTMDHYATLGVSRTSEGAVIRAAYLALMRRYHPDVNSSPEAAARVRRVTTAYGVLSDRDKRADYDHWRDFFQSASPAREPPKRPPVGPKFFAATMVFCGLGVLAVLMKPPEDMARSASAVANAKGPSAHLTGAGCMWPEGTDEIRQELVRQAAKLRSVDRRALLSIAPLMAVRIGPALGSHAAGDSGKVECTATVEMIVPSGMALPDGRQTLSGEIDYSIRSEVGERPSKVIFAVADEFAVQLASLRPAPTPFPEPKVELAETPPQTIEPTLPEMRSRPDVSAAPTVQAGPTPARAVVTRPAAASAAPRMPASSMIALPAPTPKSIADRGCRKYGTRWTELLCENERLSALDQHLGAFEAQSRAHASAEKLDELRRSWGQFSSSRVQCTTETCLRQVYLERLRRVAGIMIQDRN